MSEFKEIENKWQKAWEKSKVYEANENHRKKKYYILEMYSYPSSEGLHMGHALNYTIGDVFARYIRMKGSNVLHPTGFDSFGLPAENAAIKNNSHPKLFSEKAIVNFTKQLKELGISYDWSRLIYSHNPDYYKWNQWLFIQMFKKGLTYKKKALVNWCPKCNTVLANEQVINGKCWRHENTKVYLKELEQWFYKITKYSKELVKGLDKLKEWPQDVKQMQKNWIGPSEGAIINFKIKNSKIKIPVFTTRVDTIYGVTSILLAPENNIVEKLIKDSKNKEEINQFIKKFINQSRISREEETIEKEGIFLERYAIHPLTKKEIPVYIANFVLPGYCGGAVMSVPAHDQRDYDFAKKYNLPIEIVITPKGKKIKKLGKAYTDNGVLINSDKFDRLDNKKAINEINKYLKSKKIGKKTVEYKLKDWLLSRQRYWGTPIPIIYCDKCGIIPEKEENLPVKLPDDVKFTLGGNPLVTSESFVNVICPKCKGKARRETDTMDTFIDSSWYFLRFTDPHNDKKMFSKKNSEYWMPIDFYIGGKEHATGHLIYFRFITKVLRDLKMINLDEPSIRLFNQGMLHKGGVVMSKSKGNYVDPMYIINRYGADTLRYYLVSVSSPEKDKEWSDKGVEFSFKIMNKVLPLTEKKLVNTSYPELDNIVNKTIKNVTESIENLQYNLSTIYLKELINYLSENDVTKESLVALAKLLNPFAPHLSEELWNKLENKGFVSLEKWPEHNEEKINPEIDAKNEFLHNVLIDAKRIINLVKIKPKKITISVAESWKYELIKSLKDQLKKTRDISKILKKVMIREYATEIDKMVPILVKNETKIPMYLLSKAQELKALTRNKEFLEKELKAEVEITKDNKKAMPFKPSILIN